MRSKRFCSLRLIGAFFGPSHRQRLLTCLPTIKFAKRFWRWLRLKNVNRFIDDLRSIFMNPGAMKFLSWPITSRKQEIWAGRFRTRLLEPFGLENNTLSKFQKDIFASLSRHSNWLA